MLNELVTSCERNCLLKHVIEGKIERKGRRGRRCNELLDDFEENEKLRKVWNVGTLRPIHTHIACRAHAVPLRV